MATRLDRLYEEDFYAWTRDQAKALRSLAQACLNDAVDFAHLVEEVRDSGKNERDAVHSHVRTIMEHLLKLEYSSAREPRVGWIISITQARVALQDKLTSSLRRDLAINFGRLYAQARHQASMALRVHGEADPAAAMPVKRPYTVEQILSKDTPPAIDNEIPCERAPRRLRGSRKLPTIPSTTTLPTFQNQFSNRIGTAGQ
jgi:hypothetical protein